MSHQFTNDYWNCSSTQGSLRAKRSIESRQSLIQDKTVSHTTEAQANQSTFLPAKLRPTMYCFVYWNVTEEQQQKVKKQWTMTKWDSKNTLQKKEPEKTERGNPEETSFKYLQEKGYIQTQTHTNASWMTNMCQTNSFCLKPWKEIIYKITGYPHKVAALCASTSQVYPQGKLAHLAHMLGFANVSKVHKWLIKLLSTRGSLHNSFQIQTVKLGMTHVSSLK